jgi:hypothetical protein
LEFTVSDRDKVRFCPSSACKQVHKDSKFVGAIGQLALSQEIASSSKNNRNH